MKDTNRINQLLDDDEAAFARYKVSSSLEERLYATTDANHNVTSIDDVFGAVKERFVYDPYRNSTVLTSAWATTSDGYSWTVRSQGEREDTTTNTIDSRNRVYALGTGRWMQADNIGGYVDGANRYQFETSNPICYLDPSGNDAHGFNGQTKFTKDDYRNQLTGKHGTWIIHMQVAERSVNTVIEYWPDKDTNCTQIGFLQLIKVTDADGRPQALGPSSDLKTLGFDNTQTKEGWSVDRSAGNTNPIYGTGNNGLIEHGTYPDTNWGALESEWARMFDSPGFPDLKKTSPNVVLSTFIFNFQTFAIGLVGPNKGKVYDRLAWSFKIAGPPRRDSFKSDTSTPPTEDLIKAAALWNKVIGTTKAFPF